MHCIEEVLEAEVACILGVCMKERWGCVMGTCGEPEVDQYKPEAAYIPVVRCVAFHGTSSNTEVGACRKSCVPFQEEPVKKDVKVQCAVVVVDDGTGLERK